MDGHLSRLHRSILPKEKGNVCSQYLHYLTGIMIFPLTTQKIVHYVQFQYFKKSDLYYRIPRTLWKIRPFMSILPSMQNGPKSVKKIILWRMVGMMVCGGANIPIVSTSIIFEVEICSII